MLGPIFISIKITEIELIAIKIMTKINTFISNSIMHGIAIQLCARILHITIYHRIFKMPLHRLICSNITVIYKIIGKLHCMTPTKQSTIVISGFYSQLYNFGNNFQEIPNRIYNTVVLFSYLDIVVYGIKGSNHLVRCSYLQLFK